MKNTLVKSTLILSIAALLSKILGSLFRIPLQNIAGDEVLGIFTLVYPVYMVALTLSVAGIPIAISKLIAEARAKGDDQQIKTIFSVSGVLAAVFGVASFLLIYAFSHPIADVLGGPATRPALIVVSCTLLVAPYMAVYRGFFQGYENMAPTAVSQVIEQFIRVGLILLVAVIMVQNLYSDEAIGGGIMIGSIVGALASFVYLRLLYERTPIRKVKRIKDGSFWKTGKTILKISIPICIGAITMALLNLVDSITIPTGLKNYGNSGDEINYLYGIYGRGLALVQIVTVFASSVVLPLIPSISKKLSERDLTGSKQLIENTFFLTYLISIPAAVGLMALTLPINLGLFTDLEGSQVVAIISFSSLFTSLTVLGTGVLQGINKARLGAWIIIVGVMVKLILNLVLVNTYGLTGAAISTALVYLILFGINTYFIRKYTAFAYFSKKITAIAIASLVMGAVIWLPSLLVDFESMSRIMALLYTAIAIAIGAIIYFGLLLALKVLDKENMSRIPVLNKIMK
ncbi:Membrane protein involved in the export of O-antigen and teichoic acid [Planococcus glaciei]|uniref:putative polysaccharide biosynthesis protein n=1 Tax=Planococcus glaciei TaxID=459472 RepID=UPI00087E078C|nr:polysaccharide biosynthesis protein [Planococcus glaciei]SDH88467.1 Membrane protein involved in the export of O-antigen and teichoic acid [Planococcus glaciei]